jgi:hypothetical protein
MFLDLERKNSSLRDQFVHNVLERLETEEIKRKRENLKQINKKAVKN